MSFRRDAKHNERMEWEAWRTANAELIAASGLPPGVTRSRNDWNYLMKYGYWCENYFGAFINNIDFDLNELNQEQLKAFRLLLERTLTDEDKSHGCAAWHRVCPPSG
jgi:hypothetical protein